MKEEFKTLDELYNRVLPALKSKVSKLNKSNYEITEKELWNYLSINKWKNSSNLTLFDIVDDIINIKITDLEKQK